MSSEDVGDPEPIGLASSWTDQPPARRALPVEETPHFQATPVRVDEAFPEYEAYHSVIEAPAFDAVAPEPAVEQSSGWGETPVVALPLVPRTEEYGWVPGSLTPQHEPSVAPGLAPYPTTPLTVSVEQIPAHTYAGLAPVPTPYGVAAAPNPYQTMGMASQPMAPAYSSSFAPRQPAQLGLPDIYATAAPQGTYDIDSSGSQADVALMAVGGTFMVLKKVFTIVPFVLFAAVITFFAVRMGGTVLWAMAGFAWLTSVIALFGRPVSRSTSSRQKNAATMLRMYLGK
jgi:hypothetical protein